jgi:hypothetical protein
VTPPIARDPVGGHIPSRGRAYLYVFPCAWEDHCKLGFSRDPLSRLQTLHRRYFELFDLDRALLVETESVRDARDLELQWRRRLVEYNAPPPMTVRGEAGGRTEWYRGAQARLEDAASALQQDGHVLHAPLRPWLRNALLPRAEQRYAWSLAQLAPEELDGLLGPTPMQLVARDFLDQFTAMAIDVEPWLPPSVWRWYRGPAAT